MSVTLEQLQQYIDVDSVFHIKQEDGSLKEVEGVIRAASDTGVAYKIKGRQGIELVQHDEIEEIDLAPTKRKAPTRRRLDPVTDDKVLQHLVDRHGVPMSWAKEAEIADAVKYHDELDHKDLGHYHKAVEKAEPGEAEKQLTGDES